MAELLGARGLVPHVAAGPPAAKVLGLQRQFTDKLGELRVVQVARAVPTQERDRLTSHSFPVAIERDCALVKKHEPGHVAPGWLQRAEIAEQCCGHWVPRQKIHPAAKHEGRMLVELPDQHEHPGRHALRAAWAPPRRSGWRRQVVDMHALGFADSESAGDRVEYLS